MKFTKKIDELKDKLFASVHSNNLIYNTCWEDPRCDRKLMQFDRDSEVVMITSAGCNALDYLLDTPNHIHCIDLNPRQNALLELKLALIRHGDFQLLFQFFGHGGGANCLDAYESVLKQGLPLFAQVFWDDKMVYFTPKNKKKSFYYRGTSGSFAWLFSKYLKRDPKTYQLVCDLIDATDLDTQKAIYAKVEPRILTPFIKWMMSRHMTMALLGVPRPQRQLIIEQYPGGISGYLADNLKHIFTELPTADNYFWRLYIKGSYTETCCPNYLLEENFERLQQNQNRVSTHNTSVAGFLKERPGKYSHFILLDHQDWLAAHNLAALEEEWQLILENARVGAKILMRSASPQVDFIPDFVKDRVRFLTAEAQAEHPKDRVGTYGSTYLMEVMG